MILKRIILALSKLRLTFGVYLFIGGLFLFGPVITELPLLITGEKTIAKCTHQQAHYYHYSNRGHRSTTTIYHTVIEYETEQYAYTSELPTYLLYNPGETLTIVYEEDDPFHFTTLNFEGFFIRFEAIIYLLIFGFWSAFFLSARKTEFKYMTISDRLYFVGSVFMKGLIVFIILFVVLVLPFIIYHFYDADALGGWAAVAVPGLGISGYYFSLSPEFISFKNHCKNMFKKINSSS